MRLDLRTICLARRKLSVQGNHDVNARFGIPFEIAQRTDKERLYFATTSGGEQFSCHVDDPTYASLIPDRLHRHSKALGEVVDRRQGRSTRGPFDVAHSCVRIPFAGERGLTYSGRKPQFPQSSPHAH